MAAGRDDFHTGNASIKAHLHHRTGSVGADPFEGSLFNGSSVLGTPADPAAPASPSCLSLGRPARDNGLRSRSACDGRRRKDREVGVAALKSIEADLAIADGVELTAQETWRGAVL